MKPNSLSIITLSLLVPKTATSVPPSCPDYSEYSKTRHEPFSSGRYALSYARPPLQCRTFSSPEVESLITLMESEISDPDLYRLFQNTYPNTLDTAIRWRGNSSTNPLEELTFIITGDIDAMWLRDSANQLQSYLPLLASSNSSLSSLFRGVINLQSRYLLTSSPYCNSFQPPSESRIPPSANSAADSDDVFPPYDPSRVFECKYELDSLAAFLQLSVSYIQATGDADFFSSSLTWLPALKAVLETARSMQTPTYSPEGSVLPSPYRFTRLTRRQTETLSNDGLGGPVASGTGLIRSAFRPSDDSTLHQFLIPSNMMFARYLGLAASSIVERCFGDEDAGSEFASALLKFSSDLRSAIETHGVVPVPVLAADGSATRTETVYAYEVDGFGSANLMDDANVPSLLSAPLFGYLAASDPAYRRTRERILSQAANGYFMKGPVISAVGGPHAGPGMAWPMASIVRIMTSDDDDEIAGALKELLASTDGLGLMHESVNTFDASKWTRQWFSWANGLFGQMILDLRARKPHILRQNFQ
ncbi:hypothetical protein QBC42DRAFT_331685 [Cladorrhinum samala]|uniref:Glycoside hydrolase family 125 protein n=1 Tax=Cladorrhinum samala TaxID=585594 RepID=A0AAV9HL34_9PEZI|nr:hypothetical protein QBC42DRAFT_331685 [Cladorrhinum samala]